MLRVGPRLLVSRLRYPPPLRFRQLPHTLGAHVHHGVLPEDILGVLEGSAHHGRVTDALEQPSADGIFQTQFPVQGRPRYLAAVTPSVVAMAWNLPQHPGDVAALLLPLNPHHAAALLRARIFQVALGQRMPTQALAQGPLIQPTQDRAGSLLPFYEGPALGALLGNRLQLVSQS